MSRHLSHRYNGGMNKISTKSLREDEQSELKEKHRQAILDAGLRLCLTKGVADMDMKEVAREAGVSRATLYRYFPSKKALVYAILRRQAGEYTAGYHAQRLAFTGTGYEKFSQFVMQLVDAYRYVPDLFRFMGMVDFYYGTQDSPAGLIELYQDIFGGLLVGDTPHLYLVEGQQDGSVRPGIAPHLYTAMVIATMVSLAEQIAANKAAAQLLYGLEDVDELVALAATVLIEGVRQLP